MTTEEAMTIAAEYAAKARQAWQASTSPEATAEAHAAAAISQAHSQLALAYLLEAQSCTG